jgi:isoquinoline 1-oxidoreductase beta subunit
MSYANLMSRMARHLEAKPATGLDRRHFLKLGASLGAAGGFALGVLPASAIAAEAVALKPHQMPDAFVRVAPTGEVTVMVNRLDFGQGVATALAMLAAEELDADWSQVRSELAPAGDAYKDAGFGIQMTGGSSSVNHSWQQYRELGARTRAMFVAAAAARWKVDPASVKIAHGVVTSGTHKAGLGELAEAAMAQPVPAQVTLKDPKTYQIIGHPVKQLSGAAKSSGTQTFGLDVIRPGMKTVLIARPPVWGAKVASFDAGRTKAIKGVVDVMEVPLDRGASGVAVIADAFWPAKQGREALQVQWNTEGVEKVDSEKQLAQYRELAGKPGAVARQADVSALAGAPMKISAEYTFPYLAHTPMEPLNCTIEFTQDGAEVWVGSQFQTIDQGTMAGVMGLKPGQLKFHTMMAGGGFGRRAVPTSDYLMEAAQVAKAWRAAGKSAPLKIVWTREDDVKGGYYRPMHLHRAEIGFDATGKVLAWQHRIVGQSIVSGTPFEGFMVKNGVDETMVEGVSNTAYDVPMALDVHHPKLNVPVLWWRSVGNTHTAYVMETLVDEIARTTKQDPVAYRLKLLGDKHPRHVEALKLAVAKSGYGKRKLPAGQAWGVAVHESFESVVAYVVEASVKDGQPALHRVTAGVHVNLAVNPLNVEAQVQGAALMGLGTTLPGAAITLKDGVVQQSNFYDYTVARMPQMPAIEVHIVPSNDPPTGIGEPGLPPLAPAFANAIAALTGKPLRELPFRMA